MLVLFGHKISLCAIKQNFKYNKNYIKMKGVIMSKTLLVFHSYTGNTKVIAEKIKELIDCDMIELEPIVPFSKDYQQVVDEYQNNSIKEEVKIKKVDVDLNDYNKIIVGSPVWWYTITPVITTFLKENDLSGKTIYPFATNAGWLGHSFQDIKKLCPNSNVENGLNVVFSDYENHRIRTDENEIKNWIKNI